MSYDEVLATRVRAALTDEGVRIAERTMFGGLVFMVDGHMCVGVLGDELIVRVGRDAYAATVALDHARTMDFTGRPSTNMVYVAADGVATEADLATWVERGLAFVGTLPAR